MLDTFLICLLVLPAIWGTCQIFDFLFGPD